MLRCSFTSSLFSFHCSQDLKTTFTCFSFTYSAAVHSFELWGCSHRFVAGALCHLLHRCTPHSNAMMLSYGASFLGAPLSLHVHATVAHFLPFNNIVFSSANRLTGTGWLRVPTSLAPVALGPPSSSRPLWREPTPQHRLCKHHPYLQLISLGLWCSFFPRLLLRLPFATIPTETTKGFAAHRSLNPHKSLQGKCFYHFLQFKTAWLPQLAGSKGNAPSPAPSTLPWRPALRSTSPSAQFVHSTAKRCWEMALYLTLNSEPQQKRCSLVILQCMCCMMPSILCIRPNIFALESKFLGRADITEDSISGLCFCTPSVPRYNRDPGRAVSVRALLGSVNELPEVVLYNTGMHSSY